MEKNKGKIALGVVIALIVEYFVFRFLFSWTAPVLVALLVGNLLRPFIRFLRHTCHLPRSISVFLPIMLFFVGIVWIIYYFGGMFCGQLIVFLKKIPYYQELLNGGLGRACNWCDSVLLVEEGTVFSYVSLRLNKIFSWISSEKVPDFTITAFQMIKKTLGLAGTFGVVIIVTCMFVKDREELQEKYRNSFFYDEIQRLLTPITKVGAAYIKAQGIILSLVSITCIAGFRFAGSSYALLFGICVAIFDAFPMVGSGLILIPFAVVALIRKNLVAAAIYGTTYLLCQCIRQFLEPKLIGDKIGICPFYIMLSVYFGLKCFGLWGVILGPICLVLTKSVYEQMLEGNAKENNVTEKGKMPYE